MTGVRRRVAATLALVLVSGGCGLSDDPAPGPHEADRPVRTRDPLPLPAPGVLEIAGDGGPWVTTSVATAERENAGLEVTFAPGDEAGAFERLCRGDADVVHSTRAITVDELDGCGRRGLDVVQLQVAADAVVVAVETTADVGVDCLSLAQVRAAFGAGSEVTSWAQLGGADRPFAAAGPGPASPDRLAPAQVALGDDGLRDDYRAGAEADVRAFVAGYEPDRNLVARLPSLTPHYDELKRRVQQAWAAWARARTASGRTEARRAVDRVREKLGGERRYDAAVDARRRLDSLAGHAGLLSLGYATTYADGLRVLEVAGADGDCVLPSSQTVLADSYPLARPLLLTSTTRSLDRPVVRAFLTAALRDAPQLATRVGAVPAPPALVDRRCSWLGAEGPPASALLRGSEAAGVPADTDPPRETPAR